jgi:Mce-associated membrane protein
MARMRFRSGADPSDPPQGDPSATDPSATDSSVTDPPGAEPSVTDPPGSDASVTDSPATDPPGSDASVTDSPATDPAGTSPKAPSRPRAEHNPRGPLLTAALALVLAAAVAAVWTGWSWYAAAHDDDAAFARTRDTVLSAGEQAVQNMNTLDHADIGHGLDVWESSTTGDLHTQLVQGRADFEKQVQQAQTVSTAKVLSGAVTELDTRTGKASVMVALRITVEAPKGTPSVKESRMLGELTRTAAGWKLSELGQAPMGESASSGAATPGAPASPTTAAGH